MVPGSTVGQSVPRREGAAKVTGEARYTDDLVVPDAWYGKTIRSTVPRGTIRSITLDPGFDWTQVVVVTADDIPGDNVVQLIRDDQPVSRDLTHMLHRNAKPTQQAFTGAVQPLCPLGFGNAASHFQIKELKRCVERRP